MTGKESKWTDEAIKELKSTINKSKVTSQPFKSKAIKTVIGIVENESQYTIIQVDLMLDEVKRIVLSREE